MRPYLTEEEFAEFLRGLHIVGFEEDDDAGNEGDDDDSDEDDDEEDDGDQEGDELLSDDEKKLEPKVKEILKKERTARREAEARAKKEREKRRQDRRNARKAQRDAGKDKPAKKEGDDELTRIKSEHEELSQKNQRLSVRVRRQALDGVILREAQQMGFRDVDDAVRLVDLNLDEVVEGEDDDIEVDEDSVKEALEALAQRKPHLMQEEEEEDDDEGERRKNKKPPSGSKFGGRQKKRKGELDAEKLRERYPALNLPQKVTTGGE